MKNNLSLALIFVILTGLSGWKYVATATEYMDIETSPAMFDGFLPETVASITVTRAKRDGSKDPQGNPARERLVFQKQEGKWLVADPESPFFSVPVMSSQIVSDLLDRVGRIKVTESNIIDANANDLDQAEKEVDDKVGMRIQFLDANQQVLTDLFVGRSAGKKVEGTDEAVEGTFVRREGTKQIVLYEEAFPLDLDAKSWIDKTRRDFSNDEVSEIEVEGKADGKKINLHFKRDGNKGWKAVQTPADVGPLKSFSVTEIIRAACRVDAIDIIAPLNPALLQQYGLAPKSRIHVIIKTKDDKVLDLFIGKRVEGKQDYYAHIGGPLLFSLAEWDVSRYEKEAKEFFDPKPVEATKPGKDKKSDGDKKPGEGEKPDEDKGGKNPPANKVESPKEEAGKKAPTPAEEVPAPGDTPAKADPAKVDPAKADPAKVDPAKSDPAKGETPKKAPAPASQPAKKD